MKYRILLKGLYRSPEVAPELPELNLQTFQMS